jgi:hypothetical protein
MASVDGYDPTVTSVIRGPTSRTLRSSSGTLLGTARAPEHRSSSALCKQRAEGATLEGETTNRQRYARAAETEKKRSYRTPARRSELSA